MARNGSVRVPRSGADGEQEDSRDRISELPDSVLHLILVLMPLVDAIRTSVLSRRWRGFWKRLPLLSFDDVQVPRMSRFPIPEPRHRRPARVRRRRRHGGLVRLGLPPRQCRRRPRRLRCNRGRPRRSAHLRQVQPLPVPCRCEPVPAGGDDDDEEEEEETLQLPSFPRVTELSIDFTGVVLGMPIDTFAKLTKLFISGVRFKDGGEKISAVVSFFCPCIETLELRRVRGLRCLRVCAKSLVSMVLSRILVLEHLMVEAQNLRHMLVDKCFVLSAARADMLLSVPALEELHWQDRGPELIQHWMLPSCLRRLVVAELELIYLFGDGGPSDFTRILQLFKCVDTLRLEFPASSLDPIDQDNLIENVNVNLCSYSELKFMVNHSSHKFGPTILSLLRKFSCVKKVTLQMFGSREVVGYTPCPSNCTCRQLSVWRDNAINLDSLEWVAMYEFHTTRDERSFIYYIMRNAKRLSKVSILFSLGANPTKRFYRKLCKLSASSGCTVECYSH